MALIICPECKKRISDTASSCPNCGYQPTPKKVAVIIDKSSEVRKKKLQDRKKVGIVICMLFFIPVFFIAIIVVIAMTETPTVQSEESSLFIRKQLVWTVTKDIIKKSLNSPSTANFGKEGFYPEQSAEDCVISMGDDVFSVKGWVDSQNSFGAIVRTRFLLKMKCDGETWELLEVPIVE